MAKSIFSATVLIEVDYVIETHKQGVQLEVHSRLCIYRHGKFHNILVGAFISM